jgi:hypothetical protein
MQFLLIVGAVILFAGFLILSFYLEAKRRKELLAWAQSKGQIFSAGKNYGMEARFPVLSARKPRKCHKKHARLTLNLHCENAAYLHSRI